MSFSVDQFRMAAAEGGKIKVVQGDDQASEVRTKGKGFGKVVEWFRSKTAKGRVDIANENSKAKAEFISAIRKEYGCVMADRATYELAKHRSLSARTVRRVLANAEDNKPGFTKLHNAVSFQKQLDSVLQQNGGLEAIYHEVFAPPEDPTVRKVDLTAPTQFHQRFGLALPEFDPKFVKFFNDELMAKVMTPFQDKLLGEKTVTLGDVRLAVAEAAIHFILIEKPDAGRVLFEGLFHGSQKPSRSQVAKLFNAVNELSHRKPEYQDKLAASLTSLFRHAHESDKDVMAFKVDMLVNGLASGIIPPDTPGIAETYAMMGREMPAGAEAIKHLCAAEKCHQLAGKDTEAGKVLKEIDTKLGAFLEDNAAVIKHPVSVAKDREKLANIRANLKDASVETVSTALSSFAANIYRECLAEVDVREEDQTMMMLGSGARNEMFPFSDLEFLVLTDSDDMTLEKNQRLRKALDYFELRIAALGETPLALGQNIPVREGFCFDPGRNCPTAANPGLLGTPETVAKALAGDIVATEVFSAARTLVGAPGRAKAYHVEVGNYFRSRVGETGRTQGQAYAVELLGNQLQKMRQDGHPLTLQDLQELTHVDAKELLRLPVFLTSALSKYHGLPPEITTTAGRLEALRERGVLTNEDTITLSTAFETLGHLRLKAEEQFQGQEHRIDRDEGEDRCTLSPVEWQKMLGALESMRGLYERMERFVENPQSEFQSAWD